LPFAVVDNTSSQLIVVENSVFAMRIITLGLLTLNIVTIISRQLVMGAQFRKFLNNRCMFDVTITISGSPIDDLSVAFCANSMKS